MQPRSDKTSVVNVLRWIAVLPGAIAAFLFAQVALLIASLFMWLPDFVWQLWATVVCPVAALNAAIVIAPKYKFAVALAITTLLTGTMFIIAFLVLAGSYTPSQANKWWFLATCVAGIVAPIWMCVKLHHDDEEGLLLEE
jgi:hypothetical protein